MFQPTINEGNTSPGQSHKVRPFFKTKVWRCFVFPGVEDIDDLGPTG